MIKKKIEIRKNDCNKYHKWKAYFEIFLLVTAVFSFSYIVGKNISLDKDVVIVYKFSNKNYLKVFYEFFVNLLFNKNSLASAQEEDIPDSTLEALRNNKDFTTNYAGEDLSDDALRDLLRNLEESGRLSREDFDNPEKVANALDQSATDYDNLDPTAMPDPETDNRESIRGLIQLLKLIAKLAMLYSMVQEPQEIGAQAFQSALQEDTGGVNMCPEDKEGNICQPYPGKNCDGVCKTECDDTDLSEEELPEGHECAIGICYDKQEGTCDDRSPKGKCPDDDRSQWYTSDNNEGNNLCRMGCCILGDQTKFFTEQQCRKKIESLGLEYGEETSIWKREIAEEPACQDEGYEIRTSNKLGACVFNEQDDDGEIERCLFITGSECTQAGGSDFQEDTLCSSLTDKCSPMNHTDCINGLDEIYWFDSCGNKENIYEGSSSEQKESSYNDGEVKKKEDSCIIGTPESVVGNQGTCGNCNHFLGSICRDKTDTQKLNDESQEVVCIDMGCKEEKTGKRRENGESWCVYQAQTGLDGFEFLNYPLADTLWGSFIPQATVDFIGGDRNTDPPGSSHFRKKCENGEIKWETCKPGRVEVCKEGRIPVNGTDRELSIAICEGNEHDICMDYNPSMEESKLIGYTGQAASTILKAKLDLTCGLDPNCFVKDVVLGGGVSSSFLLPGGNDNNFKFSYCAPRYPKGFVIDTPETMKMYCQQASQRCVAVYVSTTSGWDVKSNKDCVEGSDPGSAKPSQQFVRAMSNFCVSLGDCGSEVNYKGQQPGGKGYSTFAYEGTDQADRIKGKLHGSISNPFDFTSAFSIDTLLDRIKNIDKPRMRPNGDYYYIPLNETSILGDESDPDSLKAKIAKFWAEIDAIFDEGLSTLGGGGGDNTGIKGISTGYQGGIPNAAYIAGGTGAVAGVASTSAALGGSGLFSGAAEGTKGLAAWAVGETAQAGTFGYFLGGFGAFSLGFGIGMGVTGWLIDALGIAPGISSGMAYTLMITGGVGTGIVIGQQMGFTALFGTASTNPVGWILIIIVLVVILFLKIMGVGEVVEISVEFECLPWVPPKGGSDKICGDCGTDELSDGTDKFPCTKYSCLALGQDCVFIEEADKENGGTCQYSPHDDTIAPRIVSLREDILTDEFEYDYEESQYIENFEIKRKDERCMTQYSQVMFGFNTDEWAECRIKAVNPEGDFTMMRSIGTGKNHSFLFSPLDLENLGSTNDLEEEKDNKIQLFIACKDYREKHNAVTPYIAEICVSPIDLTVPNVLDITGDDGMLPYDTNEREIIVSLEERADCRWDYDDVLYDEMLNEMQCNLFKQCVDRIPTPEAETEICIKCKDHPEWESDPIDKDRRNVWTECIDGGTTLTKSESALSAIITNPLDGTKIISGSLGRPITIKVDTSGGVDGKADCFWSLDNSGYTPFKDTGERTHHEQCIGCGTATMTKGSHLIKINCEDSAPNTAQNQSMFTIELDNTPPQITRVYQESGRLYVITNEKSTCAYINNALEGANDPCTFKASQGQAMDIDPGSELSKHSTTFNNDITYYIKCRDHPEWEGDQEAERNEPTSCNIVVRKGLF